MGWRGEEMEEVEQKAFDEEPGPRGVEEFLGGAAEPMQLGRVELENGRCGRVRPRRGIAVTNPAVGIGREGDVGELHPPGGFQRVDVGGTDENDVAGAQRLDPGRTGLPAFAGINPEHFSEIMCVGWGGSGGGFPGTSNMKSVMGSGLLPSEGRRHISIG